MKRKIEIEEIIELIDNGFDSELIAFELDIPTEYVQECKNQLEIRRQQKVKEKSSKENIESKELEENTYRENITEQDIEAHRIMEKMRKKYKKMCKQSKKSSQNEEKEDEKKTKEQVDEFIISIEKLTNEMQDNQTKIKGNTLKVINIVQKIELNEITKEQAQRLEELLSKEVFEANKKQTNKMNSEISITRKNIQRRLNKIEINTIKGEIDQADNIDELKLLSKRLLSMQKNKIGEAEGIKIKIQNKILQLQLEKNRNRSVLPNAEIAQIVENILKEDFDKKEAKEKINEIVEKEEKSKKQNKFSLTKEEQAQQIIIQIQQILENNAKKYPINNPQLVIENLIELGSSSPEIAINTVVQNLIAREETETAKQICSKYMKQYYKHMKLLRRRIANEEVRKQAIKYLTSDNISIKEESEFLESLDRKERNKEITISAITLGKSKDGYHMVTLEEIYNDSIIEK